MRTLLAATLALALAGAAHAANVEHGKQLFGRYCAACHDQAVQHVQAPSLAGVGAMAADFYLRTGYMPLKRIGLQPRRSKPVLSPGEMTDLTAYIASLGKGPAIPTPHPERGSLSVGMHLFTDHCAGCHQIVAEGGYVTGALPPPLEDATPRQIAEAVRIGPYVMPRFSSRAISDRQLDSIIRYVQYAKHPDDRGGWAIGHLGPVPEGMITWFLAATALVAVCIVIGKRLSSES
jgi:ubiquinol-cytochrome c reductase cytochrome c subunit